MSVSRIVVVAFTKFPRRLFPLMEQACEEAWAPLRKLASKLRLDRVTAVDRATSRSCRISSDESNPCDFRRTGRQQNKSISLSNSPEDINSATTEVHTFRTNDEENWKGDFRARNSWSHKPKSLLKVSTIT